jgi:uroporphyrinogen-III synthase
MTMRGRTILVTRQREQAGEMIREIELRGARAVVVPMIATGPPPSWTECDAAIGRLGTYDMLFFTSVNAVESFVGRTRILGVPASALAHARALAVGDATASALGRSGIPVVFVPGEFTGASLASAPVGPLAGKRVLLPRGNVARDTVPGVLRERGAIVDTVTVYATTRPEGIVAESFVRRVLSGEFDVVTFASPSAAANFGALFRAGELSAVPDHARIAVIGPTTADAARALGLPPDIIARESSAGGLVRGIEEFYG